MITKISIFALTALFVAMPLTAIAQTTAELQKQIDDNTAQIDALNKEIAQYEKQLSTTTTQKNTLQSKINSLNTQKKKLQASITVTQKQINTTNAQIQQLSLGIQEKQSTIQGDKLGLSESLRSLSQAETQPLAVAVLLDENFADMWGDIDAENQLHDAVRTDITKLAAEQQSLSDTKATAENKQKQLLAQKTTLSTQQGSLSATIASQADLLSQTKSQEAAYQALIAKKKAQEASFESALNDLKSQLNVAVDPSKITTAGKGILQWPLDKVVITQYFGNTAFAASGAYNGKGHNGIDLGTPIGTPIKAALSGTILGTGNTDLVRGCYSFGKWVMIKHANGINTMYAHLSQISVSTGQSVSTGDVIGYSGETGYATGPHLHFGVYVTSVTQIMKLGDATKSSTPCAGATMPVPPVAGYLNPMSYLPGL